VGGFFLGLVSITGNEGGGEVVVVGMPMFEPGVVPFGGGAPGELGVDIFGFVDAEVVGEGAGGAVIDDASFVDDEDAVVEFEIGEAVGNANDDAVLLAGELVEEFYDIAFGARIEAAGYFVAEEEDGTADEFEGEAEASFLTAGENFDAIFADGIEADLIDYGVGEIVYLLSGAGGDAELDGALDTFFDGEVVVGDAELGDVSDFGGVEIAFGGEVASFPEDITVGLGLDTGDGFEEGGFSATGGTDDGDEVAAGEADGSFMDEIDLFAAAFDGEADILEFEHRVLGGTMVGKGARAGRHL
jgi:hypothetical protein